MIRVFVTDLRCDAGTPRELRHFCTSVGVCDGLTLDGSASHDIAGESLLYNWRLVFAAITGLNDQFGSSGVSTLRAMSAERTAVAPRIICRALLLHR